MMTLTFWTMIFTALAMLSSILTMIFVLVSYLKLKSCAAEITTNIAKTKKNLEGLLLAPAIILAFGIGYMLFKKSSNVSYVATPARSSHPLMTGIVKELAFLGASQWLGRLSNKKQQNSH